MGLKDDATTVVVLKALRDTVEAEYQAARRRVFDQLCAARAEIGLKSTAVTLPNGMPVATVTLVDPHPGVVVGGLVAVPASAPRSFALRQVGAGNAGIVRAWRRGELDLRALLPPDGTEP
jgi:hypothetical protein